MNEQARSSSSLNRREFLRAALLTGSAALAAAAVPGAAFASPAQVAAAQVSGLAQVPRNQTLVTVRGGTQGKFIEDQLWNPFIPTANHQLGSQFVCEPLAFYSAYQDKLTMWLAESFQYSPDYKTLTIKTRKEAMWSDGVPFTADDVAYTYNTLNKLGAKARWGVDVQQVLDQAVVVDPQTVELHFTIPAPRFFEYSAYKYDIGIYMMPKHIFEQQSQDLATFPHFDVAKDWPVTTSPWKVVYAAPDQKVLDLRPNWWGTAAGLPMPKVQRIVYLPDPGEQNLAQGIISNAFDITTGIQPTTFPTVFQQNPKVTTWAGQNAPFGYQDWWPHSLYVNTRSGPTADADVRWAISKYIDRDQIVDFAWAGAASTAALPLPQYPGTQMFYDASQDLLSQYDTLEFNPAKGDAILQSKGFTRGSDGIWVAPDGTPMRFDITSFFDFTSVGPVLVEQLKRAGISATYSEPPNFFDRFQVGDYTMALFGHGGSYGPDPFYTLRLYQSSSEAIPGGHQVNFSLWQNSQYDAIVDDTYRASPTEKDHMVQNWVNAMQIWLPQLPDIMIEQGYHRLPTNETYWTGWPNAQNPYVNTAFFHLTPGLIVHNLQPTGA
ncbi:MAG: ABC transporter substrate-binding protein [Chloroflexi bacterium]|nr:MAG: ABC transporter substrate-binding protein [Chloroflexota bacterium]